MRFCFGRLYNVEEAKNFTIKVKDTLLRLRFCFGRLYNVEEAKNFTIKVKDTLLRLFENYMNVDEDVEVVYSVGTSINEDVNIDLMVVDYILNNLASQFKKHLKEEGGVERKNEVERYLGDNYEDPNDFKLDILSWYRHNAKKYKILSKVAQHVLAIPVSTVVSKVAFSTVGRILDPFRSSLSPSIVQALICCQNWLCLAPIPINIRTFMNYIENSKMIESGDFSYNFKCSYFIISFIFIFFNLTF